MDSESTNHSPAYFPLSIPKSLLIWGGDDILSSYVESLIAGHGGWKVIRLLSSSGLEALNKALDEHRPDMLIILQPVRSKSEELSLQRLHVHTSMKVVLINLESNFIHVLSKHQVLAAHSKDLLMVIEDELSTGRV